jgi:hypothetical protein
VNFDPLKASDSDLLSYGLSRRPQGTTADVLRWAHEMRLAKYRYCGASTSVPGVHTTPLPKVHRNGKVFAGGNWSGYEVVTNTYNVVEGQWVVPAYESICCIDVAHVTWVGLGGDGGSPLWQGGTTEDQTNGYHFWWEMYPNVSLQRFNYPVLHANDSVYAEADWNVNIANCSYLVVVDNTTGQYTNKTYCARPYQQTAEWVDERPSCGTNPDGTPKLWALQNFGSGSQVPWTYADARAGSTTQVISGWPYQANWMYDDYGNLLAYPTDLGPGGNNFNEDYSFYGLDSLC